MGIEVNIRVELPAEMAEHVSLAIGDDGFFDSIEAYISDLIRRDMEAVELAVVESHLPELRRAFAAPEQDFIPFDPEEFLRQLKRKNG